MICKGDQVRIRPEWQDKGDDQFYWFAIEDEAGGHVAISPVPKDGKSYGPIVDVSWTRVNVSMIEKI